MPEVHFARKVEVEAVLQCFAALQRQLPRKVVPCQMDQAGQRDRQNLMAQAQAQAQQTRAELDETGDQLKQHSHTSSGHCTLHRWLQGGSLMWLRH